MQSVSRNTMQPRGKAVMEVDRVRIQDHLDKLDMPYMRNLKLTRNRKSYGNDFKNQICISKPEQI